jgi:hypothetical protein
MRVESLQLLIEALLLISRTDGDASFTPVSHRSNFSSSRKEKS